MIRLQDNFNKYVRGPEGPAPSPKEFIDAMANAMDDEKIAVINALSQMASLGLFANSGVSLSNSTVGAATDLTSNPSGIPDAFISGLQGGASLSLAANSTLKFTGQSGVMTVSGAAYANFLGWFGVALTTLKVGVIPVISTHNNYFSQFHTEKQIAHEWESNTKPQLEAVGSAFRSMDCNAILSGK
jgi:hypothetical protein